MNAGVDGDTTEGMRRRLRFVLDLEPDICVVQGGGNDMLQRRPATVVLSDLDGIYRSLLAAGISPVATTVLPHGEAPDRVADVASMNRALLARADVSVCDWTTPLVDSQCRLRHWYADDGIHPNPAGVAIMATCLRRALP
jgi:lysophospholipase L1-like esterase